MPTPGVIQYPTALDDAVSLIELINNASSTLTAPISVGDLLIPVAQPGKFSASGIATLTDSLTTPTKIEIFVYTGKSSSNLVVPPGGRGAFGTTAQAFSTGNFVEQRPTARHHTALADAILALQAKLGIGADVAANGEALMGNGAGSSIWRAILQADVSGLPGALSGLASDISALNASKQPLDPDLTAIAALAANGFLRKVGGAWQMADPKTAYSVSFGMADPTIPTVGVLPPGTVLWICPDGVQITITHSKFVYKAGSHAGGSGLILNIEQGLASTSWTGFNQIGVANYTGVTPIHAVQTFVQGIVINPGDTLALYVGARSGAVAERDLTVALIGTQQVI